MQASILNMKYIPIYHQFLSAYHMQGAVPTVK